MKIIDKDSVKMGGIYLIYNPNLSKKYGTFSKYLSIIRISPNDIPYYGGNDSKSVYYKEIER